MTPHPPFAETHGCAAEKRPFAAPENPASARAGAISGEKVPYSAETEENVSPTLPEFSPNEAIVSAKCA